MAKEEGEAIPVIYVLKRDAKTAKTELEANDKLYRSLRMMPCTQNPNWIAIPITDESVTLSSVPVQGIGKYECRSNGNLDASDTRDLSPLMAAIVETTFQQIKIASPPRSVEKSTIVSKLSRLGEECCPSKLEVLGLDRTIVLPLGALQPNVLQHGLEDLVVWTPNAFENVWKALTKQMNSHRIIRRGEIDPHSPIRQSQYTLVWFDEEYYQNEDAQYWITVKEDGILQTFHIERLMFSRGNITEKMRFGRTLVQPGENVLDLYAGIGYFSLPAAIHGQARHVTCCEWNPHAVEALQRNLQLNRVEYKTTIRQADCRALQLDPIYDRVSLGLLPSSEGGWPVAVRSLSRNRGGWLHIHGNVPVDEIDTVWAPWVACRIRSYAPDGWSVIVHHVERVKSYAPRVYHCVADVRVAPARSLECSVEVGMVDAEGIVRRIESCETPSCALSDHGVLHQEWMRPI